MGKVVLGLVVGIGVGIVGTLAVQYYGRTPNTAEAHQAMLLSSAPHVFQVALPDIRVLDVSVESPSKHTVNYVYDELYDVHITYQQSNYIKEIVLPFGFSRGTPIIPPTSEMVLASDKATIVGTLTSPKGR